MHRSTTPRLLAGVALGLTLALAACGSPQVATIAPKSEPTATAAPPSPSATATAAPPSATATAAPPSPSATAAQTSTSSPIAKTTLHGTGNTQPATHASPTPSATPGTQASSVKVALDTFSIKPDTTHFKAGAITLQVTNAAKDVTHEMVVFKTDLAASALPYVADLGRLDEGKLDSIGEVADLGPGKSDTVTLNFTPGTYMLVCNIPGHFKAGMIKQIVVAP